jgi:hypothetical protein
MLGLTAKRFSIHTIPCVAIAATLCLHGVEAHAQACQPFQVGLKQEAWPSNPTQLNVFTLITSTGCTAAPGAVFCSARITLPPYISPPDTPTASLQRKCEGLVSAIQVSCGPRFALSNVDCDPNPDQSTQFTVTDLACQASSAPAGAGIGMVIANTPTGLGVAVDQQPQPDFEKDTVIPGCPTGASNFLRLSGASAAASFVPGMRSQLTVDLTPFMGSTITQILGLPPGGPADSLVNTLASTLNTSLIGFQRPERCTATAGILQCLAPGAGAAQPTLAFNTTNAGIIRTLGGGAANAVAAFVTTSGQGGCADFTTDCPALGTDITRSIAVPALPERASALLALALGAIGMFIAQRMARASI